MSKLRVIKQLEYLIAFQVDCFARGDWEGFDKAENEIKKLEEKILKSSGNDEEEEIISKSGAGFSGEFCKDYEICR